MQDDKAIIADYSKRVEKNDVDAMNNLAAKYRKGQGGLTKDEVMALRLNLRAAELGSHASIYALAAHFDLFYDGDAQDAVFAMQLATIAAKRVIWSLIVFLDASTLSKKMVTMQQSV